jgi:protein-S-isoprenylcysteine O-methyltransferase Ste14
MNAISILFYSALLLELFYILMFVLTIKREDFRFWPPDSPRSWQFFGAWSIALLVAVDFIFLGLLDFDSFILPGLRARLPVVLGVVLPVTVLGIWVYAVFPYRAIMGLGDRLVTRGPYRYTRNPQYICDILSILAYMILTNSWMAWVLGVLGIVLNILAPFTEEPWLEERFGEEYLAYKHRVPRFL